MLSSLTVEQMYEWLGNPERIFESACEALVNPINAQGRSGKGLALEFRQRFPDSYIALYKRCEQGVLKPGEVFVFDRGQRWSRNRYIIHLPTKRYWRNRSDLDLIAAGLVNASVEIRERGIRSIAIPALGCGLGQLHWEDVLPTIKLEVGSWENVRVEIYEPQ